MASQEVGQAGEEHNRAAKAWQCGGTAIKKIKTKNKKERGWTLGSMIKRDQICTLL